MAEQVIIPTEEVELKPGMRFLMGNTGTWWRVLEVDTDAMTALVIADKEICKRPYHEEWKAVTWENCTLRAWLNGEYLQQNFSEEEQSAIVESKISNPDHPEYNTPGGNDTEDRIFLLSLDEAQKYFKTDADRNLGDWWWLRSPGSSSCYAADVSYGGWLSISSGGYYVFDVGGCVRPAFKINLKSEFFQSEITFDESKTIKLRVPRMVVTETRLVSAAADAANLTVPEGVTELDERCFANMKRLQSVNLPTTLKKIGKEAFAGCKSLRAVTVQSDTIVWGKDALKDCPNLQYTSDMFINTAKLCDSFAKHPENIGARELAFIYMYQKGAVWEKVLAEKVTASNASEILSAMTDHLESLKRSVKKPAEAAAKFVVQNTLLLSSKVLARLCDVLAEKKMTELAESLRSDPMLARALQNSSETAASEQTPARVLSNGVVLYGEIGEAFTVGSRILMGNAGTWWRVLEVDTDAMTALVIAPQAVCNRPYHEKWKAITWENCTLRAWLNGEYLQQNFSEEEQSAIVESKISNPDNPKYNTPGGNDTEDRIFLLSLDEVQKYFKNDADRNIDDQWWLRSPGNSSHYVAYVARDGSFGNYGQYASNNYICIRPTFKVNLKSEFLQSVISKNIDGETVICNPSIVVRAGTVLSANPSAAEIHLPAFVSKIGAYAFFGCKNLTAVTWEKMPEAVDIHAFVDCPQLKLPAQFYLEAKLPDSAFADYMPADPALIANALLFDAKEAYRAKAVELLSAENAAAVTDELLRIAAGKKTIKNTENILRFALAVSHCVDSQRLNRLADLLDTLKVEGAYLIRREIGRADVETSIISGMFAVSAAVLNTPQEMFNDLPGLVAVLAAVQPYASAYYESCVETSEYKTAALDKYQKINSAEALAAELDHTALMALLNFWMQQESCWYAPYAAFADESELAALLKEMKLWEKDRKLREQIIRVRGAVLLNDSNDAMRYADSKGLLARYAALRGMDEDTLRDTMMDDLGLDETGHISYVLAGKTYTAALNKDLSLTLQDETGKVIRSLPKKGADPEEYAAANEAFKTLKKDIKPTAKQRNAKIFADFLSGTSRNSADWKRVYLKNPLLRLLAQLIVWDQGGHTFILKDDGKAYTADGSAYEIGEEPVKVAHPMEMSVSDLDAWQSYFTDNGLAQPFAQVWEPVVDASFVKSGRYDGCTIELYHLMNKDKHGIIMHGQSRLELKDCSADLEFKEGHQEWVHNLFEVKNFTFTQYTRQVNHIVVLLDKGTVSGRILKDDVTVEPWLGEFTLAQIMEFIDLAAKNNCPNVGALLQQYKQDHFGGADLMDMFTLDLL